MSELKEWQNMIEYEVACDEISRSRLYTVMRDKQNELEKQLQQYKSLVKTVDADNLPYETDVIGIDANMQFILSDGIWIDCLGSVSAGYELGKMTGITHYIEQKDLLKLISGV